MIDTTENTVTSARSFTPTFDPGQPVTGRRWGEQDLITGRYVEPFGTDNIGMLIDLPNGERAAIVTQTASKVGRHSAALLLPIRDQGATQVFPTISPVEQTAIEPVTGEIDLADEPEQDAPADELCSRCSAPGVDDPYFNDPLCAQHLVEAYDAEADAEYNGPTDDDLHLGDFDDPDTDDDYDGPVFFEDGDDQAAEHTAELEALAAPEPVFSLGWVRRNLTKHRVAVLCLIVGVVVGWGIEWVATR